MRDIRFRGKRKDNGKWVYGDYTQSWSPSSAYEDIGSHIRVLHKDGDSFQENEVIPETVGQWTGLKDKNDKEIYEGDILRYMDGKAMWVEWRDGTYSGWHIHRKQLMGKHIHHHVYGLYNYGRLDNCNYNHEVIGDIHTTPELLEKPCPSTT